MKNYFNNINSLKELRKQYKELLKVHHPDNGGNVSTMQEINAKYDKLFKVLKDKHESKSDGNKKESSYDNMKYNFTVSAKYSSGFPDPQVSSIIVIERDLDYFTTIMEDRLWQLLAKPVFLWRNRSGLSMNAARAA